uniref:Family with sequence similarity 169 member B n=1 Tax=Mastacembelus armatus TaxID=205130 RepID=A0A7N8X9S8_9TELE
AMYPVDLPAVDGTGLTSESKQYISSLESSPTMPNNEWFEFGTAHSYIFTQRDMHGAKCFLFCLPVVALYLHEKWWHVDDVLRTSSRSRSGLVLVTVYFYILEQSSQEEALFSLHPRTESCKLLWRDGQAVGFYTIKHKGNLCDSWSGSCYQLSVLDTMLVRRSCRRRGFGLQMLEDFCSSFPTEQFLGVSSPLSPSMVAGQLSPALSRLIPLPTKERLYEVEAPGGWIQRRNIWLIIQLGHCFHSADGVGFYVVLCL